MNLLISERGFALYSVTPQSKTSHPLKGEVQILSGLSLYRVAKSKGDRSFQFTIFKLNTFQMNFTLFNLWRKNATCKVIALYL